MKQVSSPPRKLNLLETSFFICLCLVSIIMPFGRTYTSFPLLLALLFLLFSGRYKERIDSIRSDKKFLVHISLYFLFVVGAVFSTDHKAAFFDLQLKLSIFLVPLILATAPVVDIKWIRRIVYSLVVSCFAFSVSALVYAAGRYPDIGHNAFFYKNLVKFTDIHPSYEGLFIAFSISVLTIDLINNFQTFPARKKAIYISAIFYFILFLFLLSAKMSIISCFIFLNIAAFVFLKKKMSRLKSSGILLAGNIIAFLILISLPGTRDRFNFLFEYSDVSYANSTESRTEIWKASGDMLKDHWLLGVGSGDVKPVLVSYYAQNGFEEGVKQQYNAHNEYLQVFLATGIAGILYFLFYFFNIFSYGYKKQNYLYLAFLAIFCINLLTESMLETQSGVVFFAFFNGILAVQRTPGRPFGAVNTI